MLKSALHHIRELFICVIRQKSSFNEE